jgi:hypothetical protein
MKQLIRALSPDPDKRRLYWLLRLPTLQHDHRTTLSAIKLRMTDTDRAMVRTLFSLYRPVGVPDVGGRR